MADITVTFTELEAIEVAHATQRYIEQGDAKDPGIRRAKVALTSLDKALNDIPAPVYR